jgi:hypothetical protein
MGGVPEQTADPLRADADSDSEPALARESKTTVRPPFEPSDLARSVELAERMSTSPPEPTHESLRESCRSLRIAELALAELDVGWSDSERKPPDDK